MLGPLPAAPAAFAIPIMLKPTVVFCKPAVEFRLCTSRKRTELGTSGRGVRGATSIVRCGPGDAGCCTPSSLDEDVIGVVSVCTDPPELTTAGAALLSSELQSEGSRLELEEGKSCPDSLYSLSVREQAALTADNLLEDEWAGGPP